MPGRTLIHGGRVLTPSGWLEADVLIDGDRIAEVGTGLEAPDAERVDAHGLALVPGLIDTHIHGGLEADAMDATDEALEAIAVHLAAYGVTGWLPTTVACGADQLDRVLTSVGRLMQRGHRGATIFGAHLESNFLAPKYKGAQPPEHLRPTDDAELLAVIERHQDVIKVVTLAPELPGAEALIRRLVSFGITVSVGHTDATYDEVLKGVEAGATRVTHLCNAQRPFHHREPGVVGAALVTDALKAEVIVDLVHVHPAGVEIAYRCKGAEGLMLVSDALRGTGLGVGTFELGGQTTTLDGRIARLADGTIAGSIVTLNVAVANAHRFAHIPLDEAFRMASTVPAATIGLADRGAIAPGFVADVALFDPALACRGAMISGAWAHRTEEVEVTP